MNEIFTQSWDITFETLKSSLAGLDVIKDKKHESLFYWPLFKEWLRAHLSLFIQKEDFSIEEFLTATSSTTYPHYFSTLMSAYIKSQFSTTVLTDYSSEFNGLKLFYAINSDFTTLRNFDRIKLLKLFLFNLKLAVQNPSKFKSELSMISYYFPEIKKLSAIFCLFCLADGDCARLLRSQNLHGGTPDDNSRLDALTPTSIIKEIKFLKSEGIITPPDAPSLSSTISDKNDPEESLLIMAKVRCYNCHKFGHFSRNCPLKKRNQKSHEIQLVEVPTDAEVIVANPIENADTSEEENYFIEHTSNVSNSTAANLELMGVTRVPVVPKSFISTANPSQLLLHGASKTALNGDQRQSLLNASSIGSTHTSQAWDPADNYAGAPHQTCTGNSGVVTGPGPRILQEGNQESIEEVFFLDEFNEAEFVLDSGATIHVVNDKSLLSNLRNGTVQVKGVNGSSVCETEGDVKLGKLFLKNVQFIKEAPRNIISVNCLTSENYDVQILHSKCTISKDNDVICDCSKKNNLWFLTPKAVIKHMVFLSDKAEILEKHISLGHASTNQIKEALKDCETCSSVVPKTNISISKVAKDYKIGEMICADVIGPINGCYGLIVSDRSSKFIIGRILLTKADVSCKAIQILQVFTNLLKLTNKAPIILRADNEFDTKMINNYIESNGMILELTAPHSSYQNGVSENQNKQIERKLKLLMIDSNLPESYWNFAFHQAIFLNNYFPRNKQSRSPWEQLRDCRKKLNDPLPFGCRIFGFNHEIKQKIFKKDIKGIFLGYHRTNKIALILEDKSDRIIRCSSFTGMKNVFPYQPEKADELEITSNTTESIVGSSASPTVDTKVSNDADTPMTDVGSDSTLTIPDTSDQTNDSDVSMDDSSSDNELSDSAGTNLVSKWSPKELVKLNKTVKPKPNIPTQYLVRRSKDPDCMIFKQIKTPLVLTKTNHDKRSFNAAENLDKSSVARGADNLTSKALKSNLGIKSNAPLRQLRFNNRSNRLISDTENNSRIATTDVIDISSDSSTSSEEINLLVPHGKYIIPQTYKQALATPQASKWIEACELELQAMIANSVFDLVETPTKNDNMVNGRWVFAVKDEKPQERFKARLCAKGFSQVKGENFVDIYAPVMSFETLRFFLALSALKGWTINQLDAKNAFLNADIDYPVFFKPPEGCHVPTGKCWKLKKGMYGLKQAPKLWYETISNVLLSHSFKQSQLEPCLFFNSNVMVVIYVDDILVSGNTTEVIENTKMVLGKAFIMKDLGAPAMFLGINIDQNLNGIKISLRDFIAKLSLDYDISKERILKTPVSPGLNAAETNSSLLNEKDHSKYRSIIGSLLYLANTVRLDLAFGTSLLSRYVVSPREIHMKAAIRLLQYAVQTKDFYIQYCKHNPSLVFKDFRFLNKTKNASINDYGAKGDFSIVCVSDSDYASDLEDRKSQSGSCTFLNNNLIDWSSTKQKCVSLSSTESEYISLSEASKNGSYFKNILCELGYNIKYIEICGDNMSSLTLSSHQTAHQKTKHIDVRYHYLRNLVTNKFAKLNYINTKDNVADILTKPVDSTTFNHLVSIISTYNEKL